MSLKLCSINDIRGSEGGEAEGFLEGMKGVTKYETLLNTIIDAVSKRFENYCCREFEYQQNIEEYHSGTGENTFIIVQRPPISKVTSLHDDYNRVFGDDTLFDVDNYVAGEQTVDLKNFRFRKGIKNIKVVYDGGYTDATIPHDLRLAAIMQTVFIFQRRNDLGLTSLSGEGGSISVQFPMKLLPEVGEILQNYKIWRL